jgi:hypothetical protein
VSAVAWEEPPRPVRTGRHDWHAIASDLRSKPGVWARVAELKTASSAAATASRITHGARPPFSPAGLFEAASRTVDGAFAVYARYVGEEGGAR